MTVRVARNLFARQKGREPEDYQRWSLRFRATYDEIIDRLLTVFERVNKVPFNGLRFIIDHAERASDRNIERIARPGGGIAWSQPIPVAATVKNAFWGALGRSCFAV